MSESRYTSLGVKWGTQSLLTTCTFSLLAGCMAFYEHGQAVEKLLKSGNLTLIQALLVVVVATGVCLEVACVAQLAGIIYRILATLILLCTTREVVREDLDSYMDLLVSADKWSTFLVYLLIGVALAVHFALLGV